MSPLKTIALTCAATAALTLPAMAQYGPRGHGPAEGEGVAILYQHSDFRGQSIRVTGPIPHLSQYRFNDTASSIRIQGGSWEVCVDPNFRGRCEILTYPEGELGQLRLNDNISSIRPVAGWGHDRGGWRDRPRGHDRRYDDRPGYGRGGYGGGRYGRNDAPVVLFEDADYRGEVKVILVNLSDEPFVIQRGERIAQLVIAPVATVTLTPVASLDETARGAGGFGSTGR